MHPWLDRHDVTAQRAAGSPSRDELVAVAAELAVTNELLLRILNEQRVDPTQICVTDREPAQDSMVNFPVPGTRRRIVRRTGQGGIAVLAANTPVELCHANEARLGGTLCNYGTNSATLYLCELGMVQESETQGYPTIVLPAATSWDFRLGTILWGGHVVGVSTGGTNVSIAEL